MSIQAGIWNSDGEPADEQFLERVSQATAQHGPDGNTVYVSGPIGMIYRPFHTTKEACIERQPFVSARNNVITWDGRLDNREDLIPRLDASLTDDRTDIAIVAAAFDEWGIDCFAKLLGDWALAIWNAREQTLILAKDFIGTRHLYYRQTGKRIFWCTTLEPLVLLAGGQLQIDETFVAGYLAYCPPARVTPYREINAVAPSSCVTIKRGEQQTRAYWQFNPGKTTCYATDAEYEEHFREVFKEAIRRRLRCQTPVMAELSGGMDSTSIVCMADLLIAEGSAETPRLDTMSYYDDEEPNWNERPYFQKVEEKRGRSGAHINLALRDPLTPLPESYFVVVPGMDRSGLHFETEQEAHMRAQGNRVVLSGIGGDEVLGGVPTPIPELCDLLVQFRFLAFAYKLKTWSLALKQPWTHLFFKSFRNLAWTELRSRDLSAKLRQIPWLDGNLLRTYRKPTSSNNVLPTDGCLPSQRAFLSAITHLRDQLALVPPPLVALQETRYPYLDRSLCEFLISVPREQVLRPLQRRSLMRRALSGIVPPEVLQRKRKAFVIRRVMNTYEEVWPMLQDLFQDSLSQQFHFVDDRKILEALEATIHGQPSNLTHLNRTITLELWLRALAAQRQIHYAVIGKEIRTEQIAPPFAVSSSTLAKEEFRVS